MRLAGSHRTSAHKAALLLLSGAALVFSGCGASGHATTPAASRLEREDFVAVSHALSDATTGAAKEVAATKAAWSLIANGLQSTYDADALAKIGLAGDRAQGLGLPSPFGEHETQSLTGPASKLASAFRSYRTLTGRGWQMIGAALDQLRQGSPAGARFARANVALYIDSVYDAHFSLAQIGKQLAAGYSRLGGPSAFGGSLTQREVDALVQSYSEANDRLHPHAGVRLGS